MSNETASTVYKTIINTLYVYEGDSLETAIRTWDRESVHRADMSGGIMAQSFNTEGAMVRDGWILHVSEHGHVYLNPQVR